jgi:hypothetical protein
MMTCVISPVCTFLFLFPFLFSHPHVLFPEARADLIMDCFDLNGNDYDENVNVNADMKDKIFLIATFMGVSMKEEFRKEYDEWEAEMEMEMKRTNDS